MRAATGHDITVAGICRYPERAACDVRRTAAEIGWYHDAFVPDGCVFLSTVEQHHDDLGIVWPSAVAPYDVHIIPVSASDGSQMQAAQEVYDRLLAQGAEALLDDREERPGVKFKDADLIGIPIRIVVGKDAAQGRVEWIERGSPKRETVPIDEALERLAASFRSSADCTE